jgi:hypothetical protein
LKELDRKYIQELDYAKHMREPVTLDENKSFISGLRAMLQED